jgi:hypothetical protein
MTDDGPTFEQTVARALQDVPPEPPSTGHLAASVERLALARRRRTRVLAAVSSAVAVTALAGGVSMYNGIGGESSPAPAALSPVPDIGVPRSASPVPSAVDRSAPYLMVSPSVLPPQGGEVALVVVNPTATDMGVFGVNGTLERWTGTAWTPSGGFVSSLDFWGGAGSLFRQGEGASAPAIGLSGPASGVGALQWVKVAGLAPGTYRLGQGGAYGVLEITEGAASAPMLRPTESVILTTTAAIPAMTARELRSTATEPRGSGVVTRTWSPTASLQTWTGGRWQELRTLQVDDSPAEPVGNVHEFAVTLPPLPAGTYRLLREATSPAGTPAAWAPFWVLGTQTATHTCDVVDPQANENGSGAAASWADVVRWAGRTYQGAVTDGPAAATPDQLGERLGEITCNVSTSGLGANYLLQDGDATVQPSGTPVYSLRGASAASTVVVGGRIYTVMPTAAKSGG